MPAKEKPSSKKAAAKAQKKEKAAQKTARKEKKKSTKSPRDKDDHQDDQDLEDVLEKMRQEWEAAHTVTEEIVEGPPSRRANATLIACPNGIHLWCIGGEYFSEDGKAYFYNDVFRYSPDKDEWRKFVSQTCPGPRSAHSVVAFPAGGGKLYLFGGEFSSLYQNSFHHYRDFWVFDIPTHSWERIETKVRPSARSGHRMAPWKNFIVLFGGFYDPGYRTQYLNDTWIFDTQEYKWRQIEFKESERKPSPRSGFSFLPTQDGIVLHGGYCKEYTKGKRPVGVILDDTWFLKMTLDPALPTPLVLKWEKRKTAMSSSSIHVPSARAGCTMALWSVKGTGVMFGGVTDEERGEEGLESVFWNDLYGYQLSGHGRWIAMHLKKPKKRGGSNNSGKKNKKQEKGSGIVMSQDHKEGDDEEEPDEYGEATEHAAQVQAQGPVPTMRPVPEHKRDGRTNSIDPEHKSKPEPEELSPDDPNLTRPMPRYNAMLAVLRNTLYIYGGIYELGAHEYTLDDFHALQLDKLERFVCLRPCGVVIPTEAEESSDDNEESGSESDDDEEDEEIDSEGDDDEGGKESENEGKTNNKGKEKEKRGNRRQEEAGVIAEGCVVGPSTRVEIATDKKDVQVPATASIMQTGVSAEDKQRSVEDATSTPKPGETLAMFYARTREYWAQKAHDDSGHGRDHRGKQLRRDGFGLAEVRYMEYKPMLEEVERILAEAGLDEEEMKLRASRDVGGAGTSSRNRR